MLNEALNKIVMNENLSKNEAEMYMNEIMTGKSTASQIGAFLLGLRMKGETIDEITGFAKAMKNNAISFEIEESDSINYTIDTCGTGGDGGRTFNISTAVAFITASAGIKVVKHGNRAVSSISGSADVLKELGFDIEMEKELAQKCLQDTGMTFLFAPRYHTAMKHAAPIRKELAMRTVFNVLGPLTNPAEIKGQVLGVFDKKLAHTLAEVLLKLGRERALVVHGMDGLDEITTTNYTVVSEVKNGRVLDYILDPQELGLPLAKVEDLCGGDAKENAGIILDILKGEKGPKRDIVVINTAAALYVGKAVKSLKDGVKMAVDLIDSRKAYDKTMQILAYGRGC